MSAIYTGHRTHKGPFVAVNAAARIMSAAFPSEILVSRVVTDLVAGAGVAFTPKGARELKGLPGTWEVFAAA